MNDDENFGLGVLVPLKDFQMLWGQINRILTEEQYDAFLDDMANFRHRRVRMELCPVLDGAS